MRYFICALSVLFFATCGDPDIEKSSSDVLQEDQQKIQKLVMAMHTWEGTKGAKTLDYEFTGNDSLYTGIDKIKLAARIQELKQTDYFSSSFLKNYEAYGIKMERQLKDETVKYYVGDAPPFGMDGDLWCNCQDVPDNYLQKIRLENIKITGDSASLTWTWDMGFSYKVGLLKESNQWKISYLEGFDLANIK